MNNEKLKTMLACLFLGIGIISMIQGLYRTEHMTVLQKAINICMECIGIG